MQVVWKWPAEFHPDTHNLMKQSLAIHFEGKATGLRFYANTQLNLTSSTNSNFIREKSGIVFNINDKDKDVS